jgi:hypothetical protein
VSKNFFQSAVLRSILIGGYRVYAQSQFWRRGPRVLINSIPKAGTHLVTALLKESSSLQNSGLWMEWPKINKLASGREQLPDFELDRPVLDSYLSSVRNGQYFTAHFPFDDQINAIFNQEGIRKVFVSRHPLDIFVSNFHYVMGLRRHRVHDFVANTLQTDDERMSVFLYGHPENPYMPGFRTTLAGFVPWLADKDTLALRFEDLVGARGGGDDQVRQQMIDRLAEHCGLPPFQLAASSAPQRTATLRKGKAFAWTDTLSQEWIDRIQKECSQEIKALGYTVENDG